LRSSSVLLKQPTLSRPPRSRLPSAPLSPRPSPSLLPTTSATTPMLTRALLPPALVARSRNAAHAPAAPRRRPRRSWTRRWLTTSSLALTPPARTLLLLRLRPRLPPMATPLWKTRLCREVAVELDLKFLMEAQD
ncbi:hypothetical protein CI238_10330, partial [Colletotrichum incanum]